MAGVGLWTRGGIKERGTKVKIKNIYLMCMMALFLGGCATGANQKLDQKLLQEPVIPNSAALGQEAQAKINNDSRLTPEQKTKLTQLREETSDSLKHLRSQSLQLRGLLIQDFADGNDAEVDLIHSRLNDLSSRQVSLLFDSLNKGNKILGHIPYRQEWIRETAFFYEGRE